MILDTDLPTGNDPLAVATAALRDMPIPAGPSTDAMERARRIASSRPLARFWKRPVKALAAGLAFLILSLLAIQLLRHSDGLAFADVVQAIKETHTFTASLDLPIPSSAGLPEGTKFSLKISAKGTRLRGESAAFIAIADQESDQMLVLLPMLHQARTDETGFDKKVLDLYGMLRSYHTGTEKLVGEKVINGDKTEGFQLQRRADNADEPPQVWTFWVDPATKLPVQVDILDPHLPDPITLGDLHFDVPLEDALFDMKVPAGYKLGDDANADPKKRRRFSGRIIDQRGNPIAGVEVQFSARDDTLSPGACGPDEPVKSDKDGHFSIDAGPEIASDGISVGIDLSVHHMEARNDEPLRLEFRHPDFIYASLQDMRLLPAETCNNLQITLHDGKSIAGKVIDSAGQPMAGARVEAVYFDAQYGRGADEVRFNYSKVVATGADGRFQLRGLSPDKMVVQVRRIAGDAPVLWGQATVNLRDSGAAAPVQIVASPFALPAGKTVHELFGMKLVDVDDDLRARLSLGAYEKIMILDPGPNMARLRIGQPRQGDCFWIVQPGLMGKRVQNFNEFTRELLAACEAQKKSGRSEFSVGVAYTCFRIGDAGGGTMFMKLNAGELAELQKVVKP